MQTAHRHQPEGRRQQARQDQRQRGGPQQRQGCRQNVGAHDLRARDSRGLAQFARPHGKRGLHKACWHKKILPRQQKDQHQQLDTCAGGVKGQSNGGLHDKKPNAPDPEDAVRSGAGLR